MDDGVGRRCCEEWQMDAGSAGSGRIARMAFRCSGVSILVRVHVALAGILIVSTLNSACTAGRDSVKREPKQSSRWDERLRWYELLGMIEGTFTLAWSLTACAGGAVRRVLNPYRCSRRHLELGLSTIRVESTTGGNLD